MIGVGSGLFYGFFMALGLGALQQLSTKQLKTDYSEALLGVHQVQVVVVKQPFDEAFETCENAVLLLKGCRITQKDKELGVIYAQTGQSWKSYGEKIMLTVSAENANACKVTISSKPAIGTTLVDYGKNVENLRAITQSIGQSAELIESGLDYAAKLVCQGDSADSGSGATINVHKKDAQNA